MSAANLHEVRAVTANYFFWQGWRWVPMGVVLCFMAASLSADWVPGVVRDWGVWPLLAAAFWLSTSVLGRYYRRTFGDVRPDAEQHTRRTSIKWLVIYPAMMASMVADMKLTLPVLLSGVVWGASIELYRRSTGGGRLHYAVAAGMLGALGLLPLAGAGLTGRTGVTLLVGVVGVVYIVGGLLDHRALVRVLGARPRASD
jgi:hypothetical protein